ncbi:unannotated protein [freshwater metagenome]|uniref:Unannotated protein n=1 Tax=freshwater metagenome TaxID=449393 RepID=A0A6J7LGV9_9ZZZZ
MGMPGETSPITGPIWNRSGTKILISGLRPTKTRTRICLAILVLETGIRLVVSATSRPMALRRKFSTQIRFRPSIQSRRSRRNRHHLRRSMQSVVGQASKHITGGFATFAMTFRAAVQVWFRSTFTIPKLRLPKSDGRAKTVSTVAFCFQAHRPELTFRSCTTRVTSPSGRQ